MKPWTSIDDQIAKLELRGMLISDRAGASHYLKVIGYYRLSGYAYPFRDDGTDSNERYIPGTNFSDIVALYDFDRKLRILCLDALERIELAVQVRIAHQIGRYGPKVHTDRSNFSPAFQANGQYDTWQKRYEGLKVQSAKREFVKHNLERYGELPIWVAIEIFDFGTLSHLYKMLKITDAQAIAREFGVSTPKIFGQWLKSLVHIRNVSAHHERLWNKNISDTASVPPQLAKISSTSQVKLFRYLCIMQLLMLQIAPDSKWKDNIREHLKHFPSPPNSGVKPEMMGLVRGWEFWPFLAIKN